MDKGKSGRLHSCKATWFGFAPDALASKYFDERTKRFETLIQLQRHRHRFGWTGEVWVDEFWEPNGTLRCVVYHGERWPEDSENVPA